ncbi:MAG TPA: peptide deformylase, partial [Gemmatales bacterium]|nr:peptide deformylase [Gemmatales bacterium]
MKIVRYPHPALRYKAAPVKLIDAEVRKVIDALRDLTYQHEGLGLAAPQIGIPLQLFFMNPTGEKSQPEAEMVFINPVISEKEGMIEKEEGCLSFPDLYQNVRRAASIRVKAYDPEGQAMDIKLEELPARVVQHETDHLHGKLFIDYFNVIGKLASRAALTKFEKDFQQQLDRGDLPSKKEMLKKLHELEEYYAGNRGS